MSYLAPSDLFEDLCYGPTAIINIFTLTMRGSILVVRICRRQILTTKVGPRIVRVKPFKLSRCIKASFCISEE